MGKKSFVVEVDKCTGCQLCVVACKDEHVDHALAPWTAAQPEAGQFWISVAAMERGRLPRVKVSYLPVLCQHCENAPCLKVCPQRAIKRRDDGLVWIDPAACNGCGMCQPACPYGVIYMNDAQKIAQKCTGCAHRVDDGLLPRCVDVCPHDAITFHDEAHASPPAGSRGSALEIYHPEYRTQPRVRWHGLPKPWIAGKVIDADRNIVIVGASIHSTDLFEDRTAVVRTDDFGDFWLRGMESHRKYKVEVTKQGYRPFQAVVTTDGDQDLGVVALKTAMEPDQSR